MKIRFILLAYILILLGVNSWVLNKNIDSNISIKITFGISIFCLSAVGLSLALQSLSGIGAIKIFAYATALVYVQSFLNSENIGSFTVFFINTITMALLLLPRVTEFLTRDIGVNNERIFILQTPGNIAGFTALVWSFFWTLIYFLILNISNSNWLMSSIFFIFAIIILLFFSATTTNLIRRRVIVVPNGIVLCDPITLSDTVLLPLSKLKDIKTLSIKEFRKSHARKDKAPDNEYIGNIKSKNITQLRLSERTDSFMVRNNHMSTERKDIEELFVSLVNPVKFEKYFRARFHKASEDLNVNSGQADSSSDQVVQSKTSKKLEMLKMEKELGLETAPKSDAKLPQWRDKKIDK